MSEENDIRKVRVNGTILTIPADQKVVLVEKPNNPFSKTNVKEIKTEFRKIITPKRQKEIVDFLTKRKEDRSKTPVKSEEAEISKSKENVQVKVDKSKFILTDDEWKMLEKALGKVAHGTEVVVGKIVEEIKKRRDKSKEQKAKKKLHDDVGLYVGG